MKSKSPTTGSHICSYKIKDTYPGREFSESDQQRIASQISEILTRAGKSDTLGKKLES